MKTTGTYNAATETIAVTAFGETRDFPVAWKDERFAVAKRVFSAKFRAGTKRWPADVMIWADGTLTIDTAGHANKGGAHSIVGWWDAESANNSRGR